MKRAVDIAVSLMGLLFLSPLMAVIALVIKLSDGGPVLFVQERMGQGFIPFRLYKFRTMIDDSQGPGALVTAAGDQRITRTGCFLRRTRLDELPQLVNVVKGDMSMVGPRPEVYKYAVVYEKDYREILAKTRPGLTDQVTLEFIDEDKLLEKSDRPEATYVQKILPAKIRLYKKNTGGGLLSEAGIILRTLRKTFARGQGSFKG